MLTSGKRHAIEMYDNLHVLINLKGSYKGLITIKHFMLVVTELKDCIEMYNKS